MRAQFKVRVALLAVVAGSAAAVGTLPLAGASGAPGGLPASRSSVPVQGAPLVIGRSPGAIARVRDPAELGVSITPDPAVVEGADGRVTVALSRLSASSIVVRQAALGITLPRAAQAEGVSGAGWACTIRSHRQRVACRLKTASTSTQALTPLYLGLDLLPGRPSGSLRVRGTWTQPATGGRNVSRAATDTFRLSPALPLRVKATAVDDTVGDAIPGLRAPQVVLRGTIQRRGDEPIQYRWRQLCPKDCVRVRWSTPTAGTLAPGQAPDVAFNTPQVARATTLRFVLEARDARGPARDTAQVRVLPQTIKRLDPRLAETALAGRVLTAQDRPGQPFLLAAADRAPVDVGGPGPTRVRPGGLVRLVGDVRGQRETRVRWREIRGPPFLLAHARRAGNTLSFRAPATPGPAIVRMTAWTKDGRFTRDELIQVIDTGAAVIAAAPRGARAASAGDEAFCRLVHAARQGNGEFTIPLASGGTLKADAERLTGTGCTGAETVRFAGGSTTLGDFRLGELRGTVTRDRGLVVEAGRLALPDFWNATPLAAAQDGTEAARALTGHAAVAAAHPAAGGLSIGFSLPAGESAAARVGVRLGAGGWGDLTGDLALDSSALAKLPLAESLPGGWRMTQLRLGVNPEAEQFELSATARGPSTTSGDSALELDGELTFDGQVYVQVDAANLAVLQSREGQTTVSATGHLTLLPGRRYDTHGNPEGGIVPVVDIAVSGGIKGYEPADGVTLSGSVSWETDGPLNVDGTLDVKAKGTDVRLAVAGSFTSAQDWELRGELRSDSGVRLGDVLTLKHLQGTVRRSGGELGLSFTGEATDITRIHGLKVHNAKATLSTSDCAVSSQQQSVTAPLRVCLSVDATLEVTLPGASSPLAFKGGLALDLSTLTFRATGSLASTEPFGPKALQLHDVTIWATNAQPAQAACANASAASSAAATASGVSFGFRAKGEVAGLAVNDITGAYLADNSYCLGADIGAAWLKDDGTLAPTGSNPASACGEPNAPALQHLRFTYASATEKSSLDGQFCLPEKLRADLGRIGEGTGTVHLELTTAPGRTALSGAVAYTLNKPYWLIGAKDASGTEPDDAKAALAFRSLGFTLNINSAGVEVGLDAAGTLRLPKASSDLGGDAAKAPASETPLTVGALARLGANPSFTLVVQLGGDASRACTPHNEGALRDVFGQKGLTVCQLGLAGELSASPSLSASASFTLPDEWSKQLGASNAALRVGFSVSAARPCVDLAIEQIDPNRPAMDLFDKGVVITNQAHLLVAPSGCQLPRGRGLTTIDPGFRLDFDGVVLGAKVSVFAEIKRSGAAFAVNAGFKSDQLELGALTFGQTDIQIKADPTAGTTSISVKTSAELGRSDIAKGSFHLDAAFSVSGSGPSRQISLRGSGGVEFLLAGASYKGQLTLDFSLARGEPRGSFSGSLEADLKIFKYGVNVKTLVYDRGLNALDVSAHGTVAFGAGELSASGSFTYAKNPGKTHISLSGKFAIWNVYEREVTLDMDLGRLKLPFSFGPKEGALRIPTTFGVVRVSGLNEGDVDARTDGQTTTDLTHEVEVDSCDKLEFFCLEVHNVKLNRHTGVLEGKVLGVFNLSLSARELATEKNHPPHYVTRFGNLVNESQGRCLEVPGAKYNNEQPIGTYTCVGVAHERWSLAPPGLFHAAAHPIKCLDATINKGENARPILFTCNAGAPNHRWVFDDGGRLHSVTNGNQDRCLTAVPTNNASGEVRMGVCNDSNEQRWAFSGRIRPLVYPTSDNCLGLDTENPGPQPGGELRTRICRNLTQQAANQFFAFTPSGTLQVSGLCVDAVPRSAQGNYNPKAETCDGSNRQRWELTREGQFRNRVTGLCLLADNEPAKENQPRSVQLLACGSQKRFQWDFGA